MTAVHIDKATAAEALRKAAFRVTDLDSQDYGRQLVHCLIGTMGADWDLDAALADLAKASEVAWVDGLAGHDLAVLVGGRLRNFNVRRPEEAA
jgi:hypothetical protein